MGSSTNVKIMESCSDQNLWNNRTMKTIGFGCFWCKMRGVYTNFCVSIVCRYRFQRSLFEIYARSCFDVSARSENCKSNLLLFSIQGRPNCRCHGSRTPPAWTTARGSDERQCLEFDLKIREYNFSARTEIAEGEHQERRGEIGWSRSTLWQCCNLQDRALAPMKGHAISFRQRAAAKKVCGLIAKNRPYPSFFVVVSTDSTVTF